MTVVTPSATQDGLVVALSDEVVRFVRTLHGVKAQLAKGQSEVERAAHSVLLVLAHSGPQRVSSLADRLGTDPSTASRQTAELVKRGLLQRLPDPDDRRACLLDVTAEGHEVVTEIRRRRHELLGAAVESWPAADVAAFATLLGRFSDRLDDLRVEAPTSAEPAVPPRTAEENR